MNNPKFYFLSHGDPYHAYYQHRVNEIREGRAAEDNATAPPGTGPPSAATASGQLSKAGQDQRGGSAASGQLAKRTPDDKPGSKAQPLGQWKIYLEFFTLQFLFQENKDYLFHFWIGRTAIFLSLIHI